MNKTIAATNEEAANSSDEELQFFDPVAEKRRLEEIETVNRREEKEKRKVFINGQFVSAQTTSSIPGQKLPASSNQTSRKDMLKQLTQIKNKKNQNQIDLEKLKSTFCERDFTSKSKQKAATVADPLAHEIEGGNDSFDDDSAYREESEENEEKAKEQTKVWDDEENVMSVEAPQSDD